MLYMYIYIYIYFVLYICIHIYIYICKYKYIYIKIPARRLPCFALFAVFALFATSCQLRSKPLPCAQNHCPVCKCVQIRTNAANAQNACAPERSKELPEPPLGAPRRSKWLLEPLLGAQGAQSGCSNHCSVSPGRPKWLFEPLLGVPRRSK